jgi:DNA modification methylase
MTVRILVGDVRERLDELPDGSVQCCVTSPPYFGLRDYGTAAWAGGDPECGHSVGGQVQDSKAPGAISSGVRPGVDASRCRKCGAVRQDRQIGLEATLAEYVQTMVEVFREVRRVLRDDGVLWLNLGDSYSSNTKSDNRTPEERSRTSTLGPNRDGLGGGNSAHIAVSFGTHHIETGLKPKDLMMVPARVALALQDDGWYLRSDVIWHKPNPMPESVTDRCTSAHEHIFLLTKRSRYFYDADAIREPLEASTLIRDQSPRGRKQNGGGSWESMNGIRHTMELGDMSSNPAGRNCRNVWTMATAPYKEAHFATFPPELPRRCILAGSKPGDTVLDPFAGAGTTLLVADQLGRDAVGVELNPDYAALIERRLKEDAPMFVELERTDVRPAQAAMLL